MLEKIDDRFESVSIEGFLSIDKCNVALGNVTAIIGPQAAGKSVIAKIFYFGRTYLSSYFGSVYTDEYDTRSFKADQLADFQSLFGGLDGFDAKFSIRYCIAELEIFVERNSIGGKLKIRQSKAIDSIGGKLRRAYQKYLRYREADEQNPRRASYYDFRRFSSEIDQFFRSVPSVLFVPASRSFYSTVSEELFTFLASDERVDPLTAQFGSFYEFAKRRVSGEFAPNKNSRTKPNSVMKPVLDGEFVRLKSREYIQTAWGLVPLRSASSGQQEALPLFFSLLEYPNSVRGCQLLIIEEPEAHLFPAAQKYILDLIVETATTSTCDVLFTTHSPYVLACLNTHIVQIENRPRPQQRDVSVYAYLSHDGEVSSIVEDDGLIDSNFLDGVSEQIANEFIEASG